METVFLFVYTKDNKIRVLSLNESKTLDSQLKLLGWKHTATLDACAFIQYLYNDCDNIREEIKNLSKC